MKYILMNDHRETAVRLTRYTDYALRVLIFLGLKPVGELSRIKEIADRYGISENHLMKVVHQLGQLGLIETVRGRHGGIRLSRAPGQINLGEAIRPCEDDTRLVECFDPATNTCPIAGVCALTPILEEALSAFWQVLDRYTLADLLGPRRDLGAILQLIAVPDDP